MQGIALQIADDLVMAVVLEIDLVQVARTIEQPVQDALVGQGAAHPVAEGFLGMVEALFGAPGQGGGFADQLPGRVIGETRFGAMCIAAGALMAPVEADFVGDGCRANAASVHTIRGVQGEPISPGVILSIFIQSHEKFVSNSSEEDIETRVFSFS